MKLQSVFFLPGHISLSVSCPATDVCLNADPGIASSIPAPSHSYMEIDHDINSKAILLPSAEGLLSVSIQAKVCARSTG